MSRSAAPGVVVLTTAPGVRVPVQFFPAARASAPVVLVLPGLGLPAGYYNVFAAALASAGVHAAVGELRGQGESTPHAARGLDWGYDALAAQDVPAMLAAVRDRFPGSPVTLLGHSMGAQVGTLVGARFAEQLAGLVLVAAGSPFFPGYGTLGGVRLAVGAAVMPGTAAFLGYWPGDRLNIAGFGRQPRRLMTEWGRYVRTGRITPGAADGSAPFDYESALSRLRLPVLAQTIAADTMAPPAAMEQLLRKMPQAQVTRVHEPAPLGHNGWIRQTPSVANRVAAWVNAR